MLVNSRTPAAASFRPYPDFFVPPKGTRASEAVVALTNAAPDVIRFASATPRETSDVHGLSDRPNGEAFAKRTGRDRSEGLLVEHRHARPASAPTAAAARFEPVRVIAAMRSSSISVR
jgi:hypothetical protein